MGSFHVTATWSSSDGLTYYENGNVTENTKTSFQISGAELKTENVVTVGMEETASGKSYSNLIIDDLVIWKHLIQHSEVWQFYEQGKM